MCSNCRAFITTKDRVCPYCDQPVGPRAIDRRNPSPIAGIIPHAHFNTLVILLINFGFYLATSLYSMNAGRGGAMNIDTRTLIDFGACFAPLIAAGQWWRLVTAGFLHGGLFHILMNSWVLFDLGAVTEEFFGQSRMYAIYLFSTITGFYASAWWHPMVPSIGASAALFGLIGAMIAFGIRERGEAGRKIRGFYVRWLIYGLVFSLLGFIDMAAHVGGLIGGFCLAYIAGTPRWEGAWQEKLWRGVAWVSVALTGVCFLEMYLWFTHFAQ